MADIVPRHMWCSTRGRRVGEIVTPTPRLWLHHGATGVSDRATACAYARYHIRTHGWAEIGYSFLIAGGEVLEGRGAGRVGAHTHGDNAWSHGICMVGNYESRLPTTADEDALVWLVRHGMDRGWWHGPITGGHRDAPGASTSCPGTRLWKHIPTINQTVLEGDRMNAQQEAKLDEVLERLTDTSTKGYTAREIEVIKQAVARIDPGAGRTLPEQVADEIIARLPAGTISAKAVADTVAEVFAARLGRA